MDKIDILKEIKKIGVMIMGYTPGVYFDDLNRLTSADTTLKDGETTAFSYRYDSIGNIEYKSDIGDYHYDNKAHQVSSIGSKTFEYDVNGNMINNNGKMIAYTYWNKPSYIQTDEGTIEFSYDMNQNRYKKISPTSTTYYLGKSYEKIQHINGEQEDRYFIYAEGKVVSIYSSKNTGNKTIYLHYDSLNSVDTITNNLGVVEEQTAYLPFGKKLNSTSSTNRGFTGHEHIEETDLIHMNGRVYDASIGRFLSADPYIQEIYNTQSFNRYSYVINNPMKHIDPSGYFWGIGSWFKRKAKHIEKKYIRPARPIIALAVAIYSGYYSYEWFGLAKGSIEAAIVGGATAGASSTAIMGGNSGDIFQSAFFGGLSGAVAFGVGDLTSHWASKALLHGATQGAITRAQGGRFSAGFWSAAAGSIFSPFGKNYAQKAVIGAIVGGTVSEITGGKFANGAVTGAFVYMFNHALHEAQADLAEAQSKGLPNAKIVNPTETENGNYVVYSSGGQEFIYVSGTRYAVSEQTKTLLRLTVNVASVVPASRVITSLAMILKTEGIVGRIYTLEVVNDVFNESMPPVTPHGAAINTLININGAIK